MDSRTSGPKESWSRGLGQLRTHWRPWWGQLKARSAWRRGTIQCQAEAERQRVGRERQGKRKDRKHVRVVRVSTRTDPDRQKGTGRKRNAGGYRGTRTGKCTQRGVDRHSEGDRERATTREVRDRDGQPARDSQVERGRETGRQPVEDRENPRRSEKGRGSQRPG